MVRCRKPRGLKADGCHGLEGCHRREGCYKREGCECMRPRQHATCSRTANGDVESVTTKRAANGDVESG
jgi:hypothetical protein